MEIWLRETLITATQSDTFPMEMVKAEYKDPLKKFNIDRGSLVLNGLRNQQIDQLYRSLFVYSIGFF